MKGSIGQYFVPNVLFSHHSYLFFNAESSYNIYYTLILHKSLQILKGQTQWFKREKEKNRGEETDLWEVCSKSKSIFTLLLIQ